VELVSPKKPIIHEFGKKNVVVVDFGVKHGILQHIAQMHYNVVRVPYNYTAEQVMAFDPVGVVYSNGPGNPNLLLEEAKTLRKIMEYRIPTLAICLGHQLAAIALGKEVTKMKFGHRAINKAVVDVSTHRSYITTHNHGYAIYPENIPEEAKLWFISPDDNVVEGMVSEKYNLITTQFHPEARPGTNDATFIFGMFERMVKDAT
jgi:carbamoyl-phosphate synthase small subunit